MMIPIDFWRKFDLFKKKEKNSSSKTDKVKAFLDKSLKFSIVNVLNTDQKYFKLSHGYIKYL